MRQVFLEKGAITLRNVAEPLLDDTLVLVSVHYSCISTGTEVATVNNAQQAVSCSGLQQKLKKIIDTVSAVGIETTARLIKEKLIGAPQALGYSCAGVVVAVGKKVKKFRAGDLVACAGVGFANHADLVCVPENLVVAVPHQDLLPAASATTIGAIALQGLRRAQVHLGETVCVLGLGLIGQITVQLAKANGCSVIGVDILDDRLQQAQALGADAVYNTQDPQLLSDILYKTNHHGADATLITAASSSSAIMQQAMQITRRKGRVVIVGDVGLTIERSPFYQKEIDLLMSCSYGPGRYDTQYEMEGIDYPYDYVRWTENRNMQAFVQLLAEKKVTLEPTLSKIYPINDIAKAFEEISSKKELGVVVTYVPKNDELFKAAVTAAPSERAVTFAPAKKSSLRVGIVGAGGFSKVKLIPIISGIKNTKIQAVVDASISHSLNISKLYGVARALTSADELFTENLVDVVVIASPHKHHCQQALTALQHGKAVFLEKPMVTTREQLTELVQFLQENPTVPFCVDYNRSFAPFIQRIKKELQKRTSPLMISYRMNAGFIAKDHWTQTEVGAGRIIGEACHIFDLFYHLTGSTPVSVSVEALRPHNDDLFATDNFSAQLSFADGSVCSFLYTALGHSSMGKERMEIYFDSKTIIMDDYKKLEGYGLPASFNMHSSTADKGHENLLKNFFESLQQQEIKPVIDLQRLIKISEISLIIDNLACKGGGQAVL